MNDRNYASKKEQLRQSLLELHYGLLDEGQANRLRATIATDPQVAAEWAETLKLAGKFAEAARIEIPSSRVKRDSEEAGSIPLRGPALTAEPSDNGQRIGEAAGDNASDDARGGASVTVDDETEVDGKSSSKGWWLRSGLVAAIAASIGCLIIGYRNLQQLPPAPSPTLRLQARAVPDNDADSKHEYRFVTSHVDQRAFSAGRLPVTPASLSFSVLAKGAVLFSGTTRTGPDGEGRVVLPVDLAIPDGARLRVSAESASGIPSGPPIEIPLEPTRCLTRLTVDRPVYRPGETVYFRSLTLQRSNLRASFEVPIRYELRDPSGSVVTGAELEGVSEQGVGNGAFTLPTTAPGGPYTLVAKSLDDFFPEESCEFEVRAYRVPRFKTDLEFQRRSYGAGDTVQADFSAERAEGGPVEEANVQITARVDEQVIHQQSGLLSAAGAFLIEFELPELMRRGVGTLSVTVDDGGTRETTTKTIPIQLGQVVVDFHPEGGYLVDGLRNRVYFTAHDPLGEPIHISGEVMSRSGQRVAEIETVRDGMGRFEFVPRGGDQYTLKITSPADVINVPRLPAVVGDLPVLDTGPGVFGSDQPIAFTIRSQRSRTVLARAVCRGRLVGEQLLDCDPGKQSVRLPLTDAASGVIRLTVFDGQTRQPLVERLVYRRQSRFLSVEVSDPRSSFERTPGDAIRLNLQVRDESGRPTAAVLGVAVVDDAALSLDQRERPSLRTHFLLTSEVRDPQDLEHANFYLSDKPAAAESLDLLLGTQGWRRFVSGPASQSDVDFREQLVRLLELDGDSLSVTLPSEFDNAGSRLQSWERYRAAVSLAWDRILIQTQLLLLAILLIWLAAIIVRGRRHSHISTAAGVMLVAVGLAVVGCGGVENTIVTGEVSDERTAIAGSKDDDRSRAPDPESPSRKQHPPLASSPVEMEEGQPGLADVDPAAAGAAAVDVAPVANQAAGMAGAMGGPHPDLSTLIKQGRDSNGDPTTLSPRDLQQLLAARGLTAQTLADQLIRELRFPVRQYAHRYESASDDIRRDFTETLLWQPILTTDSQGRATVRFDLSDSVTSFRIQVDGHSGNGRIGSADALIVSKIPFQLEPKVPLEVTSGDQIELPIAIANTTGEEVDVTVIVKTDQAIRVGDEATSRFQLAGGQRDRAYVTLDVLEGSAEADTAIEVRGSAGSSLSDSVRRSIHISPAGYPVRETVAGVLDGRIQLTLPIPEDCVGGSLAVTARAYPSPLADTMSGIESILREPHGCFEQTSATNYPNAMVLNYMRERDVANPDVSRRAVAMLDRGYQKLIAFECDERGYEWFGQDPGHEALSAFGLMQFNDMARIMSVSEPMIERTRSWLMGRRDGQGGFKRNPRHLHVWSVQQEIVNAYILWAISEADVASGNPHRAASELSAELDAMAQTAKDSDDPYLIGLSAAALLNTQRTAEGERLLEKLKGLQAEDGSLTGSTTVTSSGGISLKMETTAIAALAWLKSPRFVGAAVAATGWITANRQGNAGFGSTQATVLALKAITATSKHVRGSAIGNELVVLHRGEEIGRARLPADPAAGTTVEIQGLGAQLRDAGPRPEVELVAQGTKGLSFTVDVAYHAVTPDSDEGCPLAIETRLTGEFATAESVPAGETLAVETRLRNQTSTGLPMTVAIVGLPGGLEPRVERLDELQQQGAFDYYEMRGREVVFYWRTVEPQAEKRVRFDVNAAIPGSYTGPASRAYLYYTAEQKTWVEPLEVKIGR